MQRTWGVVRALPLILLMFGCAQIRANNEQYYYRQALWSLKAIPQKTKNKCGYDYDIPFPAFVADTNLLTDYDRRANGKKRPHLSQRIAIHYNPAQMEKIRHESVHYLNRMKPTFSDGPVTHYGRVSWECLDEITSQMVAENLKLRDLLGIQKARTRYYQHRSAVR